MSKEKDFAVLKHTIALVALAIGSMPGNVLSQNTAPDLRLEEYRIIGRDTSVFTITGDPLPVVSFTSIKLNLPEEVRAVRNSEGLIGEEGRLRRLTRFTMTTGPGGDILFTTGSRQVNDFYAKLGYDAGRSGGALRLTHWSGEEHTRINFAPNSQDLEISGYNRSPVGDITVDIGYTRQSEHIAGAKIRPDNRKLSRLRGNLGIETGIFGSWEVTGRAGFVRGTYSDLTAPNENKELLLTGNADGIKNLFGGESRVSVHLDRYELEGVSGSSTTAGFTQSYLLGNRTGVTAGASVAASSMPGNGTKLHVYPRAELSVRVLPQITLQGSYRPGLETHTFGDSYDANGLIALTAPILYENVSTDLRSEIGYTPLPAFHIGLGGSLRISEHAPVYSRVIVNGNEFYEIVKDADLTRRAVFLNASYQQAGKWSVSGEFRSNNASWNYSGDVPYIPQVEASCTGTYMLGGVWTFQGTARYQGRHAVELNDPETEKSFVIIDLSAERAVVRDNVSLFMEMRNCTNAKGSWWSGDYRIPGIGFYMGVRTHY